MLFALGAAANLPASATDAVDVYKSPYCGCCGKWVEHLRQAGFNVRSLAVIPAINAPVKQWRLRRGIED